MARNRTRRSKVQKEQPASSAKQTGGDIDERAVTPAAALALPYQSGISPGSLDVTGIVPDGVHVDPNILEGHPGYEESGSSGIMPTDLSRRVTGAPTKDSNPPHTS